MILKIAAVIGVVLLLLVARGVYLLGRGTETEQAARDELDGEVAANGWLVLDWLQEGDIPLVSTLEERLGINQTETEGDDEP